MGENTKYTILPQVEIQTVFTFLFLREGFYFTRNGYWNCRKLTLWQKSNHVSRPLMAQHQRKTSTGPWRSRAAAAAQISQWRHCRCPHDGPNGAKQKCAPFGFSRGQRRCHHCDIPVTDIGRWERPTWAGRGETAVALERVVYYLFFAK